MQWNNKNGGFQSHDGTPTAGWLMENMLFSDMHVLWVTPIASILGKLLQWWLYGVKEWFLGYLSGSSEDPGERQTIRKFAAFFSLISWGTFQNLADMHQIFRVSEQRWEMIVFEIEAARGENKTFGNPYQNMGQKHLPTKKNRNWRVGVLSSNVSWSRGSVALSFASITTKFCSLAMGFPQRGFPFLPVSKKSGEAALSHSGPGLLNGYIMDNNGTYTYVNICTTFPDICYLESCLFPIDPHAELGPACSSFRDQHKQGMLAALLGRAAWHAWP